MMSPSLRCVVTVVRASPSQVPVVNEVFTPTEKEVSEAQRLLDRLGSGVVSSVVYEALTEYLEKNPKDAQRICKKINLSAEARIAAKVTR